MLFFVLDVTFMSYHVLKNTLLICYFAQSMTFNKHLYYCNIYVCVFFLSFYKPECIRKKNRLVFPSELVCF